MSLRQEQSIIATGATGNITSAAVAIAPDSDQVGVQLVVEAVGGSPTITWKAQVSEDGTDWYDASYVTDAVDTLATATRTATALGAQSNFLRLEDRPWAFVRVVTSSNTAVTYRVELYQVDRD